MTSKLGAYLLVPAIAAAGCFGGEQSVSITSEQKDFPPEFVFVPADGYEIDLAIEISENVAANAWAQVNAQANSGPWVEVKYADIDPCSTWYIRPFIETDLTHSVEWLTNPPDAAEFGVTEVNASNHSTRGIRFSAPGEYEVWAITSFPTEAISNRIAVSVSE